jgi:hypothetical protein
MDDDPDILAFRAPPFRAKRCTAMPHGRPILAFPAPASIRSHPVGPGSPHARPGRSQAGLSGQAGSQARVPSRAGRLAMPIGR